MNTTPPSTAGSAFNPAQRFVDRQMSSVLESILMHAYSLANKGMIPSEQQLAAYVDGLDEGVLVRTIRKHPGAAATQALLAQDAELLRWARLAGRDRPAGPLGRLN